MKIKLITGATTYEAAVNTIKKIEPFDLETENLVVVPDSFSMQAESLIFDVLKIKSTINIEVVGISRLASKILRKENIEFQRISGLEEVFNLFKAVKKCEKDFVYFNKFGVDFSIKILQVIKQFKACKIKPHQIRKVGDDLLDRKMQDLKLIYQVYEDMLGKKLDLSRLLEFFAEKAENCLNLSKIKLFFVNFDSFSSEINTFVCKLAGLVGETNIGYAKPISLGNAFIYEDDILKKTTEYAKQYGITVEVENNPTNLKGEQLSIAKNLFSFNIESRKSDFFVNVAAKNKNDEIEFVAKYIKNEVFQGSSFKDFAVAVSGEDYYDQIKTIFGEFGIAFYCDESVDLTQTILGRFLLKLVKFARLGLQKESLQYIVSSPLYNIFNKEQILTDIEFFNVEDEKEFVERFGELENLISDIKSMALCKTIKDYESSIKKIFQKIDGNYEKLIVLLQNEKYFKKESENAQAKPLILKVLEKLSELGADENVDIFDFENLLLMSLKSVKVETIPTYVDAVYVADATESYFADVRVLFVLGATAGNLPKIQNDTAIIDDEDIRKLKIDYALEPEIKVLNRRNRLKIFEMLQHAVKKLVVCTPMSEEGKLLQKADFVNDLISMFGKNIVHTASIEEFNIGLLSKEEMLDKILFFIGNKNNFPAAYSKLKSEAKLPKFLEGTLKNLLSKEIASDDKIKSLKVEELPMQIIKKKTVSASELETYFSCPFKHFVSYSLKIKPKENIEPNKRLFGNFEHSLLKKFVEDNKMNLSKVDESQIDIFLEENLEKFAKQIYDSKILKRRYFLNFLKNESKVILKNVVLEQKYSEFRPFLLEEKIFQSFGDVASLVGFVDRIDRCGKFLRIIDYKTGKTDSVKKELYYGKKLQLFLYANAASQKFGLKCAGVYYFDCRTKYSKLNQNTTLLCGVTKKENEIVELSDSRLWKEDVRSDLLGMSRKKNGKESEFAFKNGNFVENFENFFDYAEEISKKAVSEINAGFVTPKPIKGECDFCPYISVCRNSKDKGFRIMQAIKDEDLKGQNYDN